MTINPTNCPGAGDPETWGPCTGHPNDPRTPEAPEWAGMTREQRRAELETLTRDEIITLCLDDNDAIDAAMRRLRTAIAADASALREELERVKVFAQACFEAGFDEMKRADANAEQVALVRKWIAGIGDRSLATRVQDIADKGANSEFWSDDTLPAAAAALRAIPWRCERCGQVNAGWANACGRCP